MKAKTVRIEGAILISHDKDGNVVVQQTGDHLGRKGLGYGGAVGFLVGLAAPPLLAATVVGAAAGGIAGQFAKHKMETGLHDKIGEALKPGTAAILAMFEEDQALAVQQVLAGRAGALGGPDGEVGHGRAQGLARRGDGQVQPGPDRAADPGPHLRRRRPAGRWTSPWATGR